MGGLGRGTEAVILRGWGGGLIRFLGGGVVGIGRRRIVVGGVGGGVFGRLRVKLLGRLGQWWLGFVLVWLLLMVGSVV